MRTLCAQETTHIAGAKSALLAEGENYNHYPLRVYLKRDALYGALGVGLLCASAGIVIGCLGAMVGLGLGLGCGYLEWAIYQ